MFDLRKLNNENCKVEMKRCRQTTAVYGGYVEKAVIMIPKELGSKYTIYNNKWSKDPNIN